MKPNSTAETYRKIPFPKMRRSALDAGRLGRNRHIMHGLLEMDVTTALDLIDEHETRTGERISFTAYIIHCVGKTIEHHRQMHAYLNWLRQLVIYDKVNIVTMIEGDVDGVKVPVPYLFKDVNQSTLLEIHQELRKVQADPDATEQTRSVRWLYRLPGPLRRTISRLVLRVPQWFRKYSSPVLVTSVGMFGRTAGWGIPKPSFTLTVTLGGIVQKPWMANNLISARDILYITLSINHDVVDGAPAARFTHHLKRLIEGGYGLHIEKKRHEEVDPILN